MDWLIILAPLAACGALLYGLFLLLFRAGRRKRGALIAGASIPGLFVVLLFLSLFVPLEEIRERSAQEVAAREAEGLAGAEQKAASRRAEAAKKAAEAAEKKAACRTDLSCHAERHVAAATVACVPVVERSANYTMEWTEGWIEPKFSHFRWRDRANGIVTYIGDRARFQNGFGAWQNVTYECDFDTGKGEPVDLRVKPGRL